MAETPLFADVDGIRLHHRFDGPTTAPVLLLSNSLGTNLTMWDAQIPALTKRWRVLRYDSRGHGRSDAPAGPYTIDRLGRDAVGLLDALGLGRIDLCGLSKGGMVGMWLGINAPARIGRLALTNTAAYLGPPETWEARMALVSAQGMAGVAQGVIERWFTPGFRAREPAAVDRVRAMLLATEPRGYLGCCAAIRDLDLRTGLGRITAPVLVIGGSVDPSTPPAKSEEIAAAIPGARLVMLEAAHLSNIEQAEAYTAALLDFLGE